jgi:hypothetical protein
MKSSNVQRRFPLTVWLNGRSWVQEQLGKMLEKVALSIENAIPVTLELRSRQTSNLHSTPFLPGVQGHRFRPHTIWRGNLIAGCLVRVIEIVREALADNVIFTKRYPNEQGPLIGKGYLLS